MPSKRDSTELRCGDRTWTLFLLVWSPLAELTRWCCQEEIPANSCLPDFTLSHFLFSFWVSLPWKFMLCHVLLVKPAAKSILSLSGRSNHSHKGSALPFLCTSLPFIRWCASSGLLLCLETDLRDGPSDPIVPGVKQLCQNLFLFFFYLNNNSVFCIFLVKWRYSSGKAAPNIQICKQCAPNWANHPLPTYGNPFDISKPEFWVGPQHWVGPQKYHFITDLWVCGFLTCCLPTFTKTGSAQQSL